MALTSELSTDIHGQIRKLNLEGVKNSAVESYERAKDLVLRNVILSICIGGGALLLLILCVYLRCKYKTNATVMSRRQHEQLMEQRSKRRMENERNRSGGVKRTQSELKRQEEAQLMNTSFETKATVLSDKNEEYRDIENDGIELELDDNVQIKPSNEKDREYQGSNATKGSRLKNFFRRK